MKKLRIALLGALFMGTCGTSCNLTQNSARDASTEVSRTPDTGSELAMIFVPGGTFKMGCMPEHANDCDDHARPTQQVTLSDFYIGKYEVTQKQWREVMGFNVRQQRDKVAREAPVYGLGDNHPMYYVSWVDVQEFIEKLNGKTGKNYRLPTEAEWEYAARGGSQGHRYRYSGSDDMDEVAWYDGNSGEGGVTTTSLVSHPVGTKKGNELGVHDMSGNVWEWVADLYGDFSGNPQTNPAGPESGWLYVLRGGSWFYHARPMLVTFRGNADPMYRAGHIGFRLAHD